MSERPLALKPPDDAFLRRLDSHHRWGYPDQYPTARGQEPGVELMAEALDVSHTDFTGMDLADLWWVESTLEGSRFNGSWMPGTRSYASSWRDCDLSEVQMAKAEAHGCLFAGSSFKGAYLVRTDMQSCDLRGADLSGADLLKFSALDCDLRGLAIRNTVLDAVGFNGSHVADIDLMGSTGTITGVGGRKPHPRIDIGEPDDPHWVEGDEAL
ncbi:MAG TPA: pentapeptide repeat-containing protein, partial [Candidatus Dormibacteraeota bacterium]